MKVIRETKMKYGAIPLYQEDWSENYPNIHHGADRLTAYPLAVKTIRRICLYRTRPYPERGERFRLGMHFPTEAAASEAYEKLERGEARLRDYAAHFDTTPSLTVNDLLTALGAEVAV